MLQAVSSTFHGRNVLSPVVVHLIRDTAKQVRARNKGSRKTKLRKPKASTEIIEW
jgi:S-adenosylmethionine hydrolase